MMSFLRPVIDEVALVVERADVAGVQPAVDQRLGGRLGVAPVLPEDVGAAHQDLSVLLGDADLDARHRPPHGAELEVLERADRADGRGLGHAPSLQHGNAAGVEELEDLGGDRRGARHRLVDVAAEQPADAGEQALVGLLEGLAAISSGTSSPRSRRRRTSTPSLIAWAKRSRSSSPACSWSFIAAV